MRGCEAVPYGSGMPSPRRGKTPPPPTAPEPDARARLIAAGQRVLGERGYDAATVKEVAREAGVNQGLVHYYFGSKDALLLAVTQEASRQYMSELERLRAQTPAEELAETAFAWGEKLATDAPGTCRLRYELFALGLRNRDLTPAVAQLLGQGDEEIARTVAQFRTGHATAPSAEDGHYAVIIKACVDGLALHHQLDKSFDPLPVYALLRRIILASIEQPTPPRSPARKPKAQGRRGTRSPRTPRKAPGPRRR
ncbi:TetR/AcrR family transcriptional regulator [Corallococcus carmarthensis]|uniref:TetR/AcrR family transcriptional regulator n=2 Tax=Corallococcus carmarthensis TaxID=2316728 RepID=A0A3A8KDF2_9BACT|nr:TetR/AcrR family transcriptional regulator [Corallococcus carmarthensis]RKH02365.1 TetR/AcrR family transcriptional regulator [Corallococcus carmarthensis]